MKFKLTKNLTIIAMVGLFVSCGSGPFATTSASHVAADDSRKTPILPEQKPYCSLEDASRGLAEWESYFANRGEPQAAFFTAHCETVRTLTAWIKDVKFHDNVSMVRYTVAFAEQCRRGLDAYYLGRKCPQSWKCFAENGNGGNVDTATSLLLGINAHINRDLPYAILNAGIDPSSQSSWEDHNRALDALIDAAPRLRNQIIKRYQPDKAWFSGLFGWYIDQEVRRVFVISRTRAWENAARLKSARTKYARQKIEAEIEQQSVERARRMIALKGKYTQQLWALAKP